MQSTVHIHYFVLNNLENILYDDKKYVNKFSKLYMIQISRIRISIQKYNFTRYQISCVILTILSFYKLKSYCLSKNLTEKRLNLLIFTEKKIKTKNR